MTPPQAAGPPRTILSVGVGVCAACAACGAFTASACLPPQAVLREQDVVADVYRFTIRADAQTRLDAPPGAEAPVVPDFPFAYDGTLHVQWARTFRDGSLGRLVRLDDLRDPATGAPAPARGAWVELRAFDSGQILSVGPLAAWSGTDGHLEALDVLWPTLSPRLPALEVGETSRDEVSFPTSVRGGARVQTRMSLDWTLEEQAQRIGTYAVRGTAHASAGSVTADAILRGSAQVDAAAARLLRHDTTWERTVVTRWPTGATVSQSQRIALDLRWTGTVPSTPILREADLSRGDDPVADAAPLRLADGSAAPDASVDARKQLPYLLLPDTLPEDVLEGLRHALVGPATLPANPQSHP